MVLYRDKWKWIIVGIIFSMIIGLTLGCANSKTTEGEPLAENTSQSSTLPLEQGSAEEKEEPTELPQETIIDENELTVDDGPQFAVHNGIEGVIPPGQWYKIYAVHSEDEPEGKYALLTIDDAPKGETTLKLLDALDQFEAKAIFFVNGIYAEKNPELLTEIINRGHLIGNHTWSHPSVEEQNSMSEEELQQEILRLQDYVEEVTGIRPSYFRPPHGYRNPTFIQTCDNDGMQVMNWTTSLEDWKRTTADEMIESMNAYLSKQGANILTHDFPATADNYPQILQYLHDEGYQFILPTVVQTASEERRTAETAVNPS